MEKRPLREESSQQHRAGAEAPAGGQPSALMARRVVPSFFNRRNLKKQFTQAGAITTLGQPPQRCHFGAWSGELGHWGFRSWSPSSSDRLGPQARDSAKSLGFCVLTRGG